MSTVTLKLQKTDSDFLECCASKVYDVNSNDFYHLPYWFEKVGDGLFVQYSFDELPQALINRIKDDRNVLNDTVVEDGFKVIDVLAYLKGYFLKNLNYEGAAQVRGIEKQYMDLSAPENSATLPLQQVQEDNDKPNKEQEQFYFDSIIPSEKYDIKKHGYALYGSKENFDQLQNALFPEKNFEAKDKPFVWTDELALELLNSHRTSDQIITKFYWKKESIEAFKNFHQSKQSPTKNQ